MGETRVVRVDQDELTDAYEMTEMEGGLDSFTAYVCRETGKVYVTSTLAEWDELEEIPEDIEDSPRYLPVPDKHELGLDTRLVMDFAHTEVPSRADEVEEFFRRRGGYRRFKAFLYHHKLEKRWYAFRDAAMVEALRAWCETNDMQLVKRER